MQRAYFRRKQVRSFERVLLIGVVLSLLAIGIVAVMSVTSAGLISEGKPPASSAVRDLTFVAIGLAVMLIAERVPAQLWFRFSGVILASTIVFQLMVFIPGIGIEADGNRNWVSIAGQQAQPSEFLKFGLCLWLGCLLSRKQDARVWRDTVIPVALGSLLAIGTVMGGDDLGTAMVMVLLVLGALFFGGTPMRVFLAPVMTAVLGVAFFALVSPDRTRRILAFLQPTDLSCYYTDCYQATHAIWAVAGGGIWGLGVGNSRERFWLPAASSDYVFAIVAEEFGLIGAVVVLVLFGIYAVVCFRIIRLSTSRFAQATAGAIGTWIVGQALINIGVVIGMFPVLGVPLPFLSVGGSSLISVMLATGVLLGLLRSIERRSNTEGVRVHIDERVDERDGRVEATAASTGAAI